MTPRLPWLSPRPLTIGVHGLASPAAEPPVRVLFDVAFSTPAGRVLVPGSGWPVATHANAHEDPTTNFAPAWETKPDDSHRR